MIDLQSPRKAECLWGVCESGGRADFAAFQPRLTLAPWVLQRGTLQVLHHRAQANLWTSAHRRLTSFAWVGGVSGRIRGLLPA